MMNFEQKIRVIRQFLLDVELIGEELVDFDTKMRDRALDSAIDALAPYVHDQLGFYVSMGAMLDALADKASEEDTTG